MTKNNKKPIEPYGCMKGTIKILGEIIEPINVKWECNKKLSREEKTILAAFEAGELHSVPKVQTEKKRFQNIAKAHSKT